MRQFSILATCVWLIVPLLALGFTGWVNGQRIQRLEHVAALTRGEDAVVDAGSLTGYAGGIRERVLTDHAGRSHEWIAQTQRMLGRGDWQIRQIDSENAPWGRPTHATAPYRWWLGFVAWMHHLLGGQPVGIAVERAALFADPLLHLLALLGVAVFAFRYSGPLAASLAVACGALLYPFAAGFLPGVPDDFALKLICVFGSLLPLLAGLRALEAKSSDCPTTARLWFTLAGIFGGLGFWVSPASQMPLVTGISLGALLAACIRRNPIQENRESLSEIPWRHWSLSGAITVLVASLFEFYPHSLGTWELRALHPLYGLGWLGGGELLTRIARWIERGGASWNPRDLFIKLLALAALLTVPLVMLRTSNPGFLATDLLSFRLTKQPDAALFANLGVWLNTEGLTAPCLAALLPLLWLGPALWLLARRQTSRSGRTALALILGTVAPALGLAYFQLSWWMLLDAHLLVLLVATTAASGVEEQPHRARGWIPAACALVLLLPGAFRLIPAGKSLPDNSLTMSEALGLVERDLAHWLAKRTDDGTPPIVHAPPNLTTTLAYYGGVHGLGTLSWENQEGLLFAIRTAISTSRDETAALLRRRNVTYIVVPSWDGFFDSYIQNASVQTGDMLYRGLTRWSLPPWLQPVPYRLPVLPGFENQSVRIFKVVDDQDPPSAASRLTEYFIEQGEWENAKTAHQALLKYPADFGAQVARAQLWAALRDADNFRPVFAALLNRLAAGADRHLPWDRRVSLAVVLTDGNRLDLARPQVERCLAELDESRLRSLTTGSLYHLLAMNKALGFEIADPKLRDLALQLLPAELRRSI